MKTQEFMNLHKLAGLNRGEGMPLSYTECWLTLLKLKNHFFLVTVTVKIYLGKNQQWMPNLWGWEQIFNVICMIFRCLSHRLFIGFRGKIATMYRKNPLEPCQAMKINIGSHGKLDIMCLWIWYLLKETLLRVKFRKLFL